MFNFSPEAKSALIEAGWYEGRRTDTNSFREYFAIQGFFYGEEADAFLCSFGGIVIQPDRPPAKTSAIWLQPIDGIDGTWLENVILTSQKLGKRLSVIGYLDNGEMTLTMSEDRAVYADFSGDLYFVAPSGEEAIEIMVTGQAFTQIKIIGPAFTLPNVQQNYRAFRRTNATITDGFNINQPPRFSASIPTSRFPLVTFTIGSIPFVLPLIH